MCVSEVKVNSLNHVRLFVATWTAAHQAPLSMGFSRQEYWSGLPCSPPRDLPDPGIKPESLASCALAGRFFPTRATWGFQYRAKILWHLYHVPVCGFSSDPDIKLIYLFGGGGGRLSCVMWVVSSVPISPGFLRQSQDYQAWVWNPGHLGAKARREALVWPCTRPRDPSAAVACVLSPHEP